METIKLIKKNKEKIQIGDYVSFDTLSNAIYKVRDISKDYILVEDEDTYWERKEYVEIVYKAEKEIEK